MSDKVLSEHEAQVASSAGVTILEVHASGAGILPAVTETEPGKWNLSYIERQVPLVRSYGMTPLVSFCTRFMSPWEYCDPQFDAIRCTEHDVSLPLWSVWCEHASGRIRRIVHEAARCLKQLGEDCIPLIVDGHGDYGEPIYPQGMTASAYALKETGIDAKPHMHDGFWCGDKSALRSLKETTGLDRPPKDASDEVAWVSFVRWYHDGMTEYVRKSCEAYHAELPKSLLMVFLGGGVEPLGHGQDNTALAKVLASFKGAIRSTASGSTYLNESAFCERFERNWPIIKRHATPARFYGATLWAEPPYPPGIDPALIPARVFEAMSCGATAFHEWVDHLLKHVDVYRKLKASARIVHPQTDIAVYFPTIDHWIRNESYPEDFWRFAARMRRYADYDVVDDRLILDGALDGYRLFVIPEATRVEAGAAALLEKWSTKGGTILKRPGPLSRWPGGTPMTFLGDERIVVAPDADDASLLACVIKLLSHQELVACDDRPVYATRCREGWLILNLSDEVQKVDVAGRTVRIQPLMFELVS